MVDNINFQSRGDLEKWLADKPADWARVIAARAVLRILPRTCRLLENQPLQKKGVHFSALRAIFISWAARMEPAQDMKIAPVAVGVAAAAYVAAAADAAVFAASAASAADAPVAAAYAAAYAAVADDADAAIWQSVSRDAAWLVRTGGTQRASRASVLIRQPLWLSANGHASGDMPPAPQNAWIKFRNSAFARNEGFAPWIAWYEALLPADPKAVPRNYFGSEITLRIARQPDAWWRRPSAEINADIAGWLAERDKAPPPPPAPDNPTPQEIQDDIASVLTPPLVQGAASKIFAISPDSQKIEAYPLVLDPQEVNQPRTQTLLKATRHKAHICHERLEGSNADPQIRQFIASILAALPEQVADLDAGALWAGMISVDARAKAYLAAGAQAELPPDAIATLLDLAETGRGLCSCFKEIHELEQNLIKYNLASVDQKAVHEKLDAIASVATDEKYQEVVGETARDALNEAKTKSSEPIEESVDKKLLADRIQKISNFLTVVGRWAWDHALSTGNLTKEIWEKSRPKFIDSVADGVGGAGRALVVLPLAGLAAALIDPVVGAGVILAGFGRVEIFLKLAEKYLNAKVNEKYMSKPTPTAGDAPQDNTPPDDATPPPDA